MLKKILKLEGTQELSKKQLQSIRGGVACGPLLPPCISGYHCVIVAPDPSDHDEGYCKRN